ncbi:MAG: hypothetical protein B7Y07_11665 [Halothiobacillus sp. 24-54-40]|nr:MAG: hypothetical protein B7Y07_11665 [Halothiobacillus sp. 24-54-40]
MSWRTILNANLETEPLAHNPHNTQNPTLEGNCADIADIAHRGTDLKTDKSTHALLSEILNGCYRFMTLRRVSRLNWFG